MNLLDPNPAEFRLVDIARALSRVPRFGGLTDRFYSVAEHCLFCDRLAILSNMGDAETRRAVLMHDAAEAYLGDVTRPLKALLPDYRQIEARMEAAIFHRFNVALPKLKEAVRYVDNLALATEKAALFSAQPSGTWPGLPSPAPVHFMEPETPPDEVEWRFLHRAAGLGLQ
ncbi:hypothetical protein [Paenirhodobacter populi]|uniref:hypothetical protein n=1 Tax=Paenirhodobacter populi TaxID=2306993 RepID=UPI000FE2F251|nr:hypothetical protein [Sinirhodobacter populi]RWR09725.1 hypothetical protein D2T32_05110 [Sinirhodobacter populi]